MKLMFNILFIGVLFIACKNDEIDDNIISLGAKMSAQAQQEAQNLDKNSYKELADFFLDTQNLDFSKDVFIVFGRNQCKYCDYLKDNIKASQALQTLIKENFNPYYINISYEKIHNLDFATKKAQLSTQNLGEIFEVNSTPTIIFLSKTGEVKYLFPGFTPKLDSIVKGVISGEIKGEYSLIDKKIQAL